MGQIINQIRPSLRQKRVLWRGKKRRKKKAKEKKKNKREEEKNEKMKGRTGGKIEYDGRF